MKFKVGDIVRLKHVPEEDKVQKYDKYWDGFEKWEGMLQPSSEKSHNTMHTKSKFIKKSDSKSGYIRKLG